MGPGQRTGTLRRLTFFSLSFGLHAAGAGLLLFSEFKTLAPTATTTPFEIDLEEKTAHTPSPTAPSRNAKANSARLSRVAREKRLRAFLPSALDGRPPSEDLDLERNPSRAMVSEGFSDDWAYVSDPMHEPSIAAELASPSRSLWALIDAELREDPLLSEYNHTGLVYVRFAVDPTGRLREGSLSVRAQDPILKVRSMKALRTGVANFARGGLLRARDDTWFAARFSWIDRQACQRQSRWNGHFLGFCRHAVNRTRDHSTLSRAGRVTGMALKHGPFGFAEAYDQHKKENWRHDSGFDPFEKERRDPDYDL